MNDNTTIEPTVSYQSGLNQAPIARVGKTGFYVAKSGSRTIYRFPEAHKLPTGETVQGHRLSHVNTKSLQRAYRSVYAPHVGRKQQVKLTLSA